MGSSTCFVTNPAYPGRSSSSSILADPTRNRRRWKSEETDLNPNLWGRRLADSRSGNADTISAYMSNGAANMRFASMISLVTCMCVARPAAGADNPLVVEVWPGTAPDETDNIGAEKRLMSPELDRK